MGVIRQDMFGDGKVMMDYHPHKRIELRLCGFKISVCKPYGIEYGFGVCDTPLIQISSNSTVNLCLMDFKLIENAIARAVDILNKENDGLVINSNFTINSKCIYSKDIPPYVQELHADSKKKTKTKSIPYKDIENNTVYEDEKGHQWIYAGYGYLFETSDRPWRGNHSINRSGCYYVYIKYDNIKNLDIKLNNGVLRINGDLGCTTVDTYASKKRFIKKIVKLGDGSINEIISKNNRYSFRVI